MPATGMAKAAAIERFARRTRSLMNQQYHVEYTTGSRTRPQHSVRG